MTPNVHTIHTVHGHEFGGAGELLRIEAIDEPGHGGAHHEYVVLIEGDKPDTFVELATISFQNGPIKEHGVNGITEGALLAIVCDRLRGFQSGDYRSKENACALTHIEEALNWLHARTVGRLRRGVEGTSQK